MNIFLSGLGMSSSGDAEVLFLEKMKLFLRRILPNNLECFSPEGDFPPDDEDDPVEIEVHPEISLLRRSSS